MCDTLTWHWDVWQLELLLCCTEFLQHSLKRDGVESMSKGTVNIHKLTYGTSVIHRDTSLRLSKYLRPPCLRHGSIAPVASCKANRTPELPNLSGQHLQDQPY